MAIAKEAFSASLRPPETLEQEPNSFARFIQANQALFETHSSATFELRNEEQTWRDSPEVNQLVEDSVTALTTGQSADPKILLKIRQIQQEKIFIHIFGTQEEKGAVAKKSAPAKFFVIQRIGKGALTSLQDVNGRLSELEAGFQGVRAPIAEEIRESRKGLFKLFEEFVFSDSSSLFALQDFLSNKRYGSQREAIMPFLVALAQSEDRLANEKKEGLVASASKKWISQLKENPQPEFIDEFTQSQSLKPSAIATFMSWKQFFGSSTQSDQDIREEIASILRLSPQPSIWPAELRESFVLFISSEYSIALADVRRGLEQFRRNTAPKGLMPHNLPELGERAKRVKVAPVDNSVSGEEDNKKEVPSKAIHPVGKLTKEIGGPYVIEIFSGDELMRFLSRAASSLDPSDPRMFEDLKKIVMSVRESPQGPGTTILHSAKSITVDNSHTFQTVRLRSLNPRLRLGINLAHPQAYEVRIVFAISKGNDAPNRNNLSVIGIEGIYDHDGYLGKFGS